MQNKQKHDKSTQNTALCYKNNLFRKIKVLMFWLPGALLAMATRLYKSTHFPYHSPSRSLAEPISPRSSVCRQEIPIPHQSPSVVCDARGFPSLHQFRHHIRLRRIVIACRGKFRERGAKSGTPDCPFRETFPCSIPYPNFLFLTIFRSSRESVRILFFPGVSEHQRPMRIR